MAFLDGYNFEYLSNAAESLVLEELESQLEAATGEICLCNECVLDMAAKALNSVPPLYRVSLLGTLYTANAMKDDAYALALKTAVAEAIERVRENPGHD
jgi:competence protein ComFB